MKRLIITNHIVPSGTLRRRKVLVKDEIDLLNTEIFLSVENKEIDDLRLDITYIPTVKSYLRYKTIKWSKIRCWIIRWSR